MMTKFCRLVDAVNKTPIYVAIDNIRTIEVGNHEKATQINFDKEHFAYVEGDPASVVRQLIEARDGTLRR